ncbi:MAG: hypothetical protein H0T89_27740 [Deltaproteobacteria bacterium]|nr:hypothetical protein [Deltaproteobacteria bacterium]MDQ3296669.1 hypothetical protein [Myxococcota bacterium]
MQPRPHVVIALALLAGCGVGATDAADELWDDTRDDDGRDDTVALALAGSVAIDPGTTTNAERVETLPVSRSEGGATRRVVMQLAPAQVPKLAKGDRLMVPAEVQVTTRCDIGQTAPGCGYNPNVRAQLILTGNPGDTSAAGNSVVIATQTETCTQAEHHCMFVFRPGDASIDVPDMPCLANGSCHVNLVMWAWHPDARSGDADKVLVGGNDGNYLDNGRVDGDQGRLMVIRERRITGGDRASRETSGGGDITVNTSANPVLIYSHRLKPAGEDLQANEQFLVEARIVTTVSTRARFSTEMFLTRNPNAIDGNGVEAITPAAINEHNGVNCTPGGACVTRKVAVFRVDRRIGDAIYVNVIAKSAVPGGGSARVTVQRNAGSVRSLRYAARFAR